MAKKPPNIDSKKKAPSSKKNTSSETKVRGDKVPQQLGAEYENPPNENAVSASNQKSFLLTSGQTTSLSLEGLADSTPIVDSTPNFLGTTPLEEQAAASAIAEERIAEDTTEEETQARTVGSAPHFFSEQDYQVYYHDVVIYIQGADVSDWLEGSVTVKYGLNKDPNTCDFTLNNAANRFVLTPENLAGVWRRSPDSLNNDYDESAKEEIFRFKNDPNYNQPDPASNGLVWPLSHWGLIFHKYDPIRVWIRNPSARYVDSNLVDEWLPVFAGYLTSFPKRDNHLNAGSSLTMHAEDIRTIMKSMRVNTNTYLFLGEGVEAQNPSTSFNPKVKEANSLRFGSNKNVHFQTTFFRDLLINGTQTDDPWADLTFKEVVEALTFANDAHVIINNSSSVAERRINQEAIANEIAARKARGETVTPEDEKKLAAVVNAKGGPGQSTLADSTSTSPTDGSSSTQSRLGRMQRGIFRDHTYPSNREDQIEFLERWYSLCAFGTPVRDDKDYLRFNLGELRYWTLAEVQNAGLNTKTSLTWAPDAQAVHLIEPGVNTPALPIFQQYKLIDSDNVAPSTRLFTTRLELLEKACELIDYRFWVTGTGDLVFEFPQYDFSPKDYGRWEDVLVFDQHILSEDLDEEASDISTVMVGKKSLTGIVNTQESPEVNTLTSQNIVVVWSPVLAARLGINTSFREFPRVTDSKRLLQLTYMAFQKQLGTFTRYSISANYRPWIQPNRPIYNKYRARYALTEGVTFTLPVTAGSRAGFTHPTSSMNLNYIRSIDALGVPRYVTGGPSMPIFFGEQQKNNLTASLNKTISGLDSALDSLKANRNALTAESLKKAFDNFGSFLPVGQDFFNILNAPPVVNEVAAASPNYIEELNSAAIAVRKTIEDLQSNKVSTRTKAETDRLIEAAQEALKTLTKLFAKVNISYTSIAVANNGEVGPDAGKSGVWHTSYIQPKDAVYNESTEKSPDNTCQLDHYQFSSPLGKAPSDLTLSNQVIQKASAFPRVIVTKYGEPSTLFPTARVFNGVDFLAKQGETVYSVADGIVTNITDSFDFGKTIMISHYNGYLSSYAPVKASVSLKDKVIRNQPIGTIENSARSKVLGTPVLHFQTGAGLTETLVGFITGERKVYPITEEDVRWLIRALVGEAGPVASIDSQAVVSCMLNRYALINDTSLATKGNVTWNSITHMLVGAPPSGAGYSTPVSYFTRTPTPPTPEKYGKINREPDTLNRRKYIRELGTSSGDPFPAGIESLVRDMCKGVVPLIGNGCLHFRASGPLADAFITEHAKQGAQREVREARNAFISFANARAWVAKGYPKIQSNPPPDFKLDFYEPTNKGTGSYPGVPNLVYSSLNPAQRNREAWEDNKVLIAGSLASIGLGPELVKLLQTKKAKIETFEHVNGIPGTTGSSRDLTYGVNFEEFVTKLNSFKPDVVFLMYGASNINETDLSKGLNTIKEAVLKVGAKIWWIGPPSYPSSLPQYTYRPTYESVGVSVFGNNYISSTSFTEANRGRSSDLLYVVGTSAAKWAEKVLSVTSGKNINDPNDKPTSDISLNGWESAIPPEDCPPVRQVKYAPVSTKKVSTSSTGQKYKSDDMSALLPSFRSKIETLLTNMKNLGYDPIPFDTIRTPAEAQANAAKGTGIVNSMHLYGAAVDIISGSRGWSFPEFFADLGKQAESLGLTWGGRFARVDNVHVQALPGKYDNSLSNMSASERDAFISNFYIGNS